MELLYKGADYNVGKIIIEPRGNDEKADSDTINFCSNISGM